MSGLEARFRKRVLGGSATPLDGETLLVAVSGGADSITLLHLLRFTTGLPRFHLHALHVDHRWRPESGADALWLRGICRAWGVPLTVKAVANDTGPGSETQARELRHSAIAHARAETRAAWAVLAHHADDQAETVLHRVARGTGPRGLSAMAEVSAAGLWRPLLGFWRAELRTHAEAAGLSWRADPANRETGRPRNYIRHRVIPALEEGVSSAARRSLVRLAELAADEDAAWDAALRLIVNELAVKRHETGTRRTISMDSRSLATLAYPLRARVIRRFAEELGYPLDRVGTGIATRFSSGGGHGRVVEVTGGLRLRRDPDRITLVAPPRPTALPRFAREDPRNDPDG